MDNSRTLNYFTYFSSRVFLFCIFYYVWNSYFMSSFMLGMLKQVLYQLTCSNRASDYETLCILENPLFREPEETINCANCESVLDLKKLYDTSYVEINMYLQHNIPVIVIDGMFDWKIMKTPVDLKNFTNVFEWQERTISCKVSTNVNSISNNLMDIFYEITEFNIKSWFIHWENCDLKAMKFLRYFYEQPYFFKYYYPASTKNSIFISENYATSNYRQIKSNRHRVMLLMQIRGNSKYKLIPKDECKRECSSVNGILEESQILILPADLWNLWYIPGSNDLNISISIVYSEKKTS